MIFEAMPERENGCLDLDQIQIIDNSGAGLDWNLIDSTSARDLVPGGSCTARKLRDLQCAGSPHGASMIIFTPAAPSGFRSSFPGREMTWSFALSTGDGLRLYLSVSACVATCFPNYHWHPLSPYIISSHTNGFSSALPRLLGPHFKQLIIVVAPFSSPISRGTVPLVPKPPCFMALLGYRNVTTTQKILQVVIARVELEC